MTKDEMIKALERAQYYQRLCAGLADFHIYAITNKEDGTFFFNVYIKKEDENRQDDNGVSISFFEFSDFKECINKMNKTMCKYGLI